MGFEKIAGVAFALAVAAASLGQLPRIVDAVRWAQLKLIQESKASKWGKPIDMTNFSRKSSRQ